MQFSFLSSVLQLVIRYAQVFIPKPSTFPVFISQANPTNNNIMKAFSLVPPVPVLRGQSQSTANGTPKELLTLILSPSKSHYQTHPNFEHSVLLLSEA